RRLWRGDTSLWSSQDENKWLGWLHVVEGQLDQCDVLARVADEARGSGFEHVLLLGMGGSSLCPEVLATTYPKVTGVPELYVLDSTVPAQIATAEKALDLSKTLFLVSSKSGTTTESEVLRSYFAERAQSVLRTKEVGSRFIAVTDPGTKLHELAKEHRFR